MTYHGSKETQSKETGSNDGQNPMDPFICGPPIPEQPYWNHPAQCNHGWQAIFWFRPSVLGSQPDKNAVAHQANRDGAKQTAYTQTNIRKASNPDGEVVLSAEDGCEGCKEEISIAKQDS